MLIPQDLGMCNVLINLLDSPLSVLVSSYFTRERKCVETLAAEISTRGTEAMVTALNVTAFY